MDFNTGGSEGEAPRPERGSGGGFSTGNPVGSFVETVRGVVLGPVGFFSGLQRQGDYLSPLIFALIVYEISAILTGIISVAVGNTGIGGFILTLILTPIFATIVLFIGAGIFHLLVMLLVSPHSGFESTFRTGAYASVTGLVTWIPIIGAILSLYSIVLAVLGIRELHDTTTGRATLVVLIPVAVLFVIGLLIAAVIGAVLFSMLR